jgi:uncharacterized protein YegP (UPF0339 family)
MMQPDRFEIRTHRRGLRRLRRRWTWVLISGGNGEIVATSEPYVSAAHAARGAADAQKVAARALLPNEIQRGGVSIRTAQE